MKINLSARTLLSLSLCFLFYSVRPQNCGTCTVTITGHDTLAYTLNTGQVLCIDSLGEFTGSLTISGGSVCNKGLLNPSLLTVNSGTVINHALLVVADTLASVGNGFVIYNDEKGVTAFKGQLTLNGGYLQNSGILNVKRDFLFTSGVFSNSAILNCRLLTGAAITTIVNSGIINTD